MPNPVLTVGMATFDDFDGVWSTLVGLKASLFDHPEKRVKVKFLVVDNNPNSPQGMATAELCKGMGVQYVALPHPVGTAPPRNEVFRQSKTKWTMCLDSHVYLMPGVLLKVIEYCEKNDNKDLHYGVLMQSKLWSVNDGSPTISWTHWAPRWGEDGLYGKSQKDKRGFDPANPAFVIPHAGSGLFLAMTKHWLGWHQDMRGFGVEGYLAAAYRKEGREVYCHPFMRWVHRFRPKTIKAPYPTDWESRTLNAVVTYKTTGGFRLTDIKDNLAKPGRCPAEYWAKLMETYAINEQEVLRQEAAAAEQQAPTSGPGTELKKLLASIGIHPKPGCDCEGRMQIMNNWKVQACEANFWTIVGWMKDGADRWEWTGFLTAAVWSVFTGLAFKIDPRDPFPGLVRLAIENAKANEKKGAA